MHELEKQIAKWRQTMAGAAGQRQELLDELETHLREEIERLLRSGVAEGDAFPLAVANLGTPSALAGEYAKVIRKAPWLPVRVARILGLIITVLLSAILLRRMGDGRIGVLLLAHVLSVTMGYVSMFLIGGLSVCYIAVRWFREPGPTARHSLQCSIAQFAYFATVLTGVGVLLGMVWAKEHMGRYWAWDLKEVGGFLVLSWALLLCVVQSWKRTPYSILVLMGILANAITAWAWFGTTGSFGLLHPLMIGFMAIDAFFLVAGSISIMRQARTAW